MARDKTFAKITQEEWDDVININLNAAFGITKAAWTVMKEKKSGKIINTGSMSGLYGMLG